ncbi:MAG: hypothetical protein ACE5IB_02565, partial [Candidatus Geothermarchaeales archaeon]
MSETELVLVWKHRGILVAVLAVMYLLIAAGFALLTVAMDAGEVEFLSLHLIGLVLLAGLTVATTFWAALHATVRWWLRVHERGVTLQVGRWRPRVLPWEEIAEVRHGEEAFYEGLGSWTSGYALTVRSKSRWRGRGIRVTSQRFRERGESSLADFASAVARRARSRGIQVAE